MIAENLQLIFGVKAHSSSLTTIINKAQHSRDLGVVIIAPHQESGDAGGCWGGGGACEGSSYRAFRIAVQQQYILQWVCGIDNIANNQYVATMFTCDTAVVRTFNIAEYKNTKRDDGFHPSQSSFINNQLG